MLHKEDLLTRIGVDTAQNRLPKDTFRMSPHQNSPGDRRLADFPVAEQQNLGHALSRSEDAFVSPKMHFSFENAPKD